VPSGDTVLEVLPGRTPEPWDVEEVVDALVRHGAAARVFVDLSELDTVDSAFVARLVSMSKLLRSSAGRLLLCGLRPVVREMFDHLRLDKAFEISQGPTDAVELA
jgi:anti-sigma B factor antagonist